LKTTGSDQAGLTNEQGITGRTQRSVRHDDGAVLTTGYNQASILSGDILHVQANDAAAATGRVDQQHAPRVTRVIA